MGKDIENEKCLKEDCGSKMIEIYPLRCFGYFRKNNEIEWGEEWRNFGGRIKKSKGEGNCVTKAEKNIIKINK